MPSITLQSKDQLKELGNDLIVLNFWADWAPPCAQLNVIFDQLADKYQNVKFAKIDAEKTEELIEAFEIAAVPTFIFLKAQKVVDKVEGANGPDLANKLSKYAPDVGKDNIRSRCERLVNAAPVMLFMKGSADAPACGFSRKMVDLLRDQGLQFDSFNILTDEEVRNGLKDYSNWPTYPQLFVEGKLIGGLDVTKALVDDGEFWKTVPMKYQSQTSTKKQKTTDNHLSTVQGSAPTPSANNTTTTSATTPSVTTPPVSDEELNKKLKSLIETGDLMLFMKGTPDAPKCGFSKKVVERLRKNNLKFESFDILTDESVRQGLKEYSNWPTFPQLYHKTKLIGGCDIILEMDDKGELSALRN